MGLGMIDISLYWQSILVGLSNGMVYALIGLGITVVFRGSKIVNAMQGDFALIAGMMAYILMSTLGAGLVLAFLGGILASALCGLLIECTVIRMAQRRGADDSTFLLITLSLAFVVSAAALLFFGRDTHALPGIGGESSFSLFGAAVRVHSAWLIAISLAVVLLLRVFYARTRIGLMMMAASIDPDGAATTGINVAWMRTLTFILGGAVGGVAGVLVAPLITVHYEMGLLLTLKGFGAAVLGGLANPFGAVVGGIVLGLIESVSIVSISSGYKDVISMTLLIGIMILMPNGILGRGGRRGG